MTWRIHEGDALTVLRGMPSEAFNCCVTSPPYWGLRDYGTGRWEGGEVSCEHRGRPKPRQDTSGGGPDKGRFAETRGTQPGKRAYSVPVREVCRCGARRVDLQLGLEPTPELYVARVVEIFREVRRVLRADGSVWLNLGDCYATNAGAAQRGAPPSAKSTLRGNGHTGGGPKLHAGRPIKATRSHCLKPKDLVGIPWMVAFALRADGWWLRSSVIWSKTNPMPESVTDRPTKAHEDVFLLSKSERYYYDGEAIAEPATGPVRGRTAANLHKIEARETRNARTVWTMSSQPFSEAHFATFPPELARRCVLAGCPPGGTVLDPFAGAGTTLMVAARLGRNSEGIELNTEYADMARRRIERDRPLFNVQSAVADSVPAVTVPAVTAVAPAETTGGIA